MQDHENVTDRLDSIERQQRMTAWTLNHFHEEIGNGARRLRETCLDIAAYKSFISTTHVNLDKVLPDRLATIQTQVDILASFLSAMPNMDVWDA